LSYDSYGDLVGKFVVTGAGQMLVEKVDLQLMRAYGHLPTGQKATVALETILDSEVTEVDWHDPELIEKYLAGEEIVPDVRRREVPAALPAPCRCECGVSGGCYRLHQAGTPLGHYKTPAVGCDCSRKDCGCLRFDKVEGINRPQVMEVDELLRNYLFPEGPA